MNHDLKKICKPFVSIGQFQICYVQPDPLPEYIKFLHQLRMEGLDFVRIPINTDENRMYLRSYIIRIIESTGIKHEYIEKIIDDFNLDQSASNRQVLLDVVNVVINYTNLYGIEFLTLHDTS